MPLEAKVHVWEEQAGTSFSVLLPAAGTNLHPPPNIHGILHILAARSGLGSENSLRVSQAEMFSVVL